MHVFECIKLTCIYCKRQKLGMEAWVRLHKHQLHVAISKAIHYYFQVIFSYFQVLMVSILLLCFVG